MNTPLVSIIIPTYNRAHLIGETLESVLAQTYTNWECIVVDDGSTDETDKLLATYCEKDRRFQYQHRPADRAKGANSCRNYGFELIKGEYVLFFDSDDLIDCKILKSCVQVLKSNLKLDFIFFNYLVFEKVLSNIIIKQKNESNNPFLDYFAGKINLATPAILWCRETIFNMQFNEYLYKSQELSFTFNLFTKCKDQPIIGFYLNENGFFLRKHENSIVSFFHNLKTNYLLSDIMVRNQILKYFNKIIYNDIHIYQRLVIKKSLRSYLYHSSLNDFIKIIFKLYSPYKFLGIIKAKLLFYKIVFTLTKRDYRLNKAINLLYIEEFYLDYN